MVQKPSSERCHPFGKDLLGLDHFACMETAVLLFFSMGSVLSVEVKNSGAAEKLEKCVFPSKRWLKIRVSPNHQQKTNMHSPDSFVLSPNCEFDVSGSH